MTTQSSTENLSLSSSAATGTGVMTERLLQFIWQFQYFNQGELQLLSSDWKKHNHHHDKNYDNVILHVVWEDDFPDYNIPVLNLKSRVAKVLLQRYEELMKAQGFIPCEKTIASVKPIILESWKERLLAERLIRKAAIVETFLDQNDHHWEE